MALGRDMRTSTGDESFGQRSSYHKGSVSLYRIQLEMYKLKLSVAKDLVGDPVSCQGKKILRCAQDDRFLGLAEGLLFTCFGWNWGELRSL
jgi:hypothetical protein